MTKILALLHTQADGTLPKAALEALSAGVNLASQAGAALSVGVLGKDAATAADTLAGCGAQAFFVVEGDDYCLPRYSTDAAAATALVKAAGADVVVAPGTSRFARCMPGVAYRAGAQIDTHIISLVAEGETLLVGRRVLGCC